MNERTNQPKTFEEWYAKYPELASYMQSMRDAFAAGLEACDCAAALRAKDEEIARLRQSLQFIWGGCECECQCDDENCCAKVGEYCPGCMAKAALTAQAEKEKPTEAGKRE